MEGWPARKGATGVVQVPPRRVLTTVDEVVLLLRGKNKKDVGTYATFTKANLLTFPVSSIHATATSRGVPVRVERTPPELRCGEAGGFSGCVTLVWHVCDARVANV
eukprot:4420003-Pyramimonas_sp.AAC.1